MALEQLASEGEQFSVDFTPDDHPSTQKDVMTPAAFQVVGSAGDILFSSRLEQIILLDPDMTIVVSMSTEVN